MSWWIMPTTADVGIRAFSSSINGVIREVTLGMQAILLSELGAKEYDPQEYEGRPPPI